jgi:serine/threonine protein kinase
MSSKLVKTGACSIILGSGHYGDYLPPKKNKLLKIVKSSKIHNEFRLLNKIREIKKYKNYYSIPDEISHTLKPGEDFYKKLINLVAYDDIKIFYGNLECYYIVKFSKKIMEGLKFLHDKKICHIDIKPENIMVNKYKKEFKIIDFGFSSMEPFDDFIENLRGTPGYFPKKFDNIDTIEFLPEIEANDFIYVNNSFPLNTNRNLVYKIDSYCLGRVLLYIVFIYKTKRVYQMFNYEKNSLKKIEYIIGLLTENDVNKRKTVTELLSIIFNEK